MATLASLIVKIGADTRDLKKGLGSAQTQMGGLKKSAVGLRGAMVGLGAAAGVLAAKKILEFGAAATVAAVKTFELGASVEETADKFTTVFGPASDSVQDFIDDFGVMAGLSRSSAQEITATTGAIAQGMGFAQEASAEFAREAVILAGDIGAFNNIPVAETARAIQAAITGERESLKRLGVVILETDVQKRALVDTGKQLASALTQEEKATATLALITERAGVQIGNLVETSGSAEAVARRLRAQWLNLKEALATAVLPIFDDVLKSIEDQTVGMEDLITTIRESAANIQAWADVTIEATKLVAITMASAAIAATNFGQIIAFVATRDLPALIRNAREMAGAMRDLIVSVRDLTLELDFDEALANRLARIAEEAERTAPRVETVAQTFARLGISASATAGEMRPMRLAIVGVSDATVEAISSGRTFIDVTEAMARAAREAADAAREQAEATRKLVSEINQYFDIAEKLKGGDTKGALKAGAIIGATVLGGPVAGAIVGGLGGLLGFDHGGSIGRGQAGIVGERGPEIVQGPAHVTSRSDTARMMGGGDFVFNLTIEQEGIVVGRVTKRQKRNASLGVSERLVLPAPSVG